MNLDYSISMLPLKGARFLSTSDRARSLHGKLTDSSLADRNFVQLPRCMTEMEAWLKDFLEKIPK